MSETGWIWMKVAAAWLVLAPAAIPQSSKPGPTWYESLGSALRLAVEQPTRIVDQGRRQRAADALHAAGVDPSECGALLTADPGGKVTPGFPLLDACAAYNNPGVQTQPAVRWNVPALWFVAIVFAALLLGGAATFWLLRERHAIRTREPWRPDLPPLGTPPSRPLPKIRLLPSRVRVRLRMPW